MKVKIIDFFYCVLPFVQIVFVWWECTVAVSAYPEYATSTPYDQTTSTSAKESIRTISTACTNPPPKLTTTGSTPTADYTDPMQTPRTNDGTETGTTAEYTPPIQPSGPDPPLKSRSVRDGSGDCTDPVQSSIPDPTTTVGWETCPKQNVPNFCREDTTKSEDGDLIVWPETEHSKNVLSKPRCLDKFGKFITRRCVDSCWLPESVPNCHKIQQVNSGDDYCAEGYEFWKGHCVMIQPANSWSDICLKTASNEDFLHIHAYSQIAILENLYNKSIDMIWLPARQMQQFGPLTWMILGNHWKEPVEYYNKILSNNRCLSLIIRSNITFVLEDLDCSMKLPMICLQNVTISQYACPEGYYTVNYQERQHTCYGARTIKPSTWLEAFPTSQSALAVTSTQLNNIVHYVMNLSEKSDKCWIGLEKAGDSFVWKNGNDVTYVNWNADEDYSGAYGIINKDGSWSLLPVTKNLKCYVTLTASKILKPEIVLKFYPHQIRLELTLYSPEALYHSTDYDPGVSCFTDATAALYSRVHIKEKFWESNWTSFDDHYLNENNLIIRKVIYNLYLEEFPGNYWCEGFILRTLDSVTSDKVFAYKQYYKHIYSLLAYLPLNVFSVFSKNSRSEIFGQYEGVEIFRLQKILDVDADRSLTILHMILEEPLSCDMCNSEHGEIIYSYRVAKNIVEEINNNTDVKVLSMNNTLYCIPEEYISGMQIDINKVKWTVTELGRRVTTSELCLEDNGLPIYRSCIGDITFGAIWQDPSGSCDSSIEPSNTTINLFSLSLISTNNITCTECVTKEVLDLISDNSIELIPADVYYVGTIFEKVTAVSDAQNSFNYKQIVLDIISKISVINATTIKLSQIVLNSTNTMTDSIQKLLEIIPRQKTAIKNRNEGFMVIRSSEFIFQISNPLIGDIAGIALIKNPLSNLGNLDDYDIVQVTSHQNPDELLETEGIELSTWIPNDLLQRINETTYQNYKADDDLTIIISVYSSDVLFQENNSMHLGGKVVSVSIPGYGPHLPLPLQILFRQNYQGLSATNVSVSCSYWNYDPKIEDILGKWDMDGCVNSFVYETENAKITVCACSHLTNFAQLVTGTFKQKTEQDLYHYRNLNIITIIGCSLSIFGILVVFIIAALYKSWRRKTSTKVLLQLSSAIAVEMIIMFAFNSGMIKFSKDLIYNPGFNSDKLSCILSGTILHYSVLASFCWMVVIAFMQYLRFVRVLGVIKPAKFIQKSACFAWGSPSVPVIIVLLVDCTIYVPVSDLESSICYPTGFALLLAVISPITVMVLINLILYTLVLISVIGRPKEPKMKRSCDPNLTMAQLRLSLFLFFQLGLTWIFGLASAFIGEVIFSYLFCITATLQGFVIFVYFVIMDPATRSLWNCFGKTKASEFSTS